MPKIYLTDSLILGIYCPDGKDQEIYWDHPVGADGVIRNGSVSGLGLRVTALGSQTFVHAYLFNGKKYRKSLGSTVVLNVASARMAVIKRQQQLDAGENPDFDEASPRRAHLMTVGEAIDRYWESHVSALSPNYRENYAMFLAPWLRKAPLIRTRRGHNIKKRYSEFGTLFKDRPFASIKPLDIERFQNQFTSPHTHNSALRHLSALYNWADRMQLVEIRNPCRPIRKKKAIRRRRDYSTEQIKAIAAHIFCPAIEVLPEIADLTGFAKRDMALKKASLVNANDQMLELCNLMGILLLTMARPSDLAAARFEHFDLDRLVWHKHNTKGIKLSKAAYEYEYRSVPIHAKVADLVRSQRQRWPDSDLVFPSHTDIGRPRDNFRRGLERFKSLPGVPEHFQLYDLKRIAISLMLTGQGVSREAVSHYVDHKGNLETTMIYDLGLVDPLRPVTERLGVLLGV